MAAGLVMRISWQRRQRERAHKMPNTTLKLTDGRVTLQPLRLADAAALFEAVRESLAELSAWMPWCRADYSIEETRAYLRLQPARWRKGEEYSFAVREASSGRLLGGCGVNQVDRAALRANLGYWVRSDACGRGVASAAARLLAQYALATLDLERLEIIAAVDNRASQRVAEKIGAVREGIARRRVRVHGRQSDAVVFSLVREDIAAPAEA